MGISAPASPARTAEAQTYLPMCALQTCGPQTSSPIELRAGVDQLFMQGIDMGAKAAQGMTSHAAVAGRRTAYLTHDAACEYAELLVEHLGNTDLGISACDGRGKCLLAFVSGVVQSLSEHPWLAAVLLGADQAPCSSALHTSFVCGPSVRPGQTRSCVQAHLHSTPRTWGLTSAVVSLLWPAQMSRQTTSAARATSRAGLCAPWPTTTACCPHDTAC